MMSVRRKLLRSLKNGVVERLGSFNCLINTLLCLLGLLLVAGSTGRSWFEVYLAPAGGVSHADQMVVVAPKCTSAFQWLMAGGCIGVILSWLVNRRCNLCSTTIAALMCVIPLAFPFIMILCSPVVSAEATWLQLQHDNLLWLGGDIYNNAEYGNLAWKSKAYLIDLPQQLSVVRLPSSTCWENGLDRSGDLLLWLGYSNAFCNYSRDGWTFAVIGSFFLLLSTLHSRGQLLISRAGIAIGIIFTIAAIGSSFAYMLPYYASCRIQKASQMSSDGQLQESLAELNAAADWFPVIAQDTYYVAQRGVLEAALGLPTEYAQLRSAIDLEGNGCYEAAFQRIIPLVDSADPAIRREALRAVMRFAIHDFNCDRFELSRDRFQQVLARQPCNLKLIYLVQLQAIREGRPNEVFRMRDWMYAASDKMSFGTSKILRAASNQHAVLAAGMLGDAQQISTAQSKAKRP